MSPARLFLVFCTIVASASITTAQIGGRVRVLRGDGTELHIDGTVGFRQGNLITTDTTMPLSHLVRIDFPSKETPARSLTILSNGDELPIVEPVIEDDLLSGRVGGQSVQVPLEFINAIGFRLPETASARRNRMRLLHSSRDEDTVTVQGDDQVAGEIVSMTEQTIVVQTANARRELPRKIVKSLHFASDLQSSVPNDKTLAIVQTASGSIVTVSAIKSAGDDIELTTMTGATLRVPRASLQTIQCLGSGTRYLSEISPGTGQHTPYAGRPREWQINRNIDGGVLRHNGRRYSRGIGTTSRSTITWKLDGTHSVFHSAFGIDDTAKSGAAIFRVRLDDRVVFDSGVVRSRDGLRRTPPTPIRNAASITLEVDYGPRGDIDDVANWIDPVVAETKHESTR